MAQLQPPLSAKPMATLDIPNRYLALAPVVVTSPTTRCGTTLVQRLLTASDNAFIYGEEIGNQLRTLTALFIAQITADETNGEALDRAFVDALAGTGGRWRPGLIAPGAVMLRAWTEIYYQLPATLAAFGQSLDRPVWGFKWPGYTPDALAQLRALMPETRVVYVTRNLVDALQSAKARKFVTNPLQTERFCAEWARNMDAFAAGPADERILNLRYETLVSDKAAQIETLAAFTGTAGIQAAELDIKVNTFVGEEGHGRSPTQYIAPEPLTAEEWKTVATHAGAAMARHYPDVALRPAA